MTAQSAGRAPAIGKVLAVASDKGGVGKSTIALNLAVALAQADARVGLLNVNPTIPRG